MPVLFVYKRGEFMTTIEYLALPLYKRVFYKFIAIISSIPKGIGRFFTRKVPAFFKMIGKAIGDVFSNIYHNFIDGDWKTKTSYFIMGFGQITRGSRIRGIFNLAYQIIYFIFMIFIGVKNILALPTFGTIATSEYTHPDLGITVYESQDDSFYIMLIALFALAFTVILLMLWYAQITESMELQCAQRIGRRHDEKQVLKDFTGKNYHKVLLGFPTLGLVVFTIIPLIFMILIAFTNYSSTYNNPKELFDWVGMYNFELLIGGSGGSSQQFAAVFGKVLIWTLIWAFFATFTNYFLGMIVAMIINKKGIKLKKLWRTCLITTIAVPQFITLMFLSKSLGTYNGTVNEILKMVGIVKEGFEIKFLEDQLIAKVTIIVVNMWIGIPYTMLMCSGILMNIPADLYESAKIDGASPFKMYVKITLPYMLFVTGPYLISSFVGNINNFNVIYLLSGGGPGITKVNVGGVMQIADANQIYGAGHTDLLITWLYKMCMTSTEKNYALASVIGICIFIVLASISLVIYSRSSAVKNEEDFR